MKTRLVVSSLAALVLAFNTQPASADDAHPPLVTALAAAHPHASQGEQAKVYDRLLGTWNVEYTDFAKDGKVTHRAGQFIVGWIMDGRAIQALWIVDPAGDRKEREVYTALWYFDPKTQSWPAAFVDPEHASVARFLGGAVGEDRIVLNSMDFPGLVTRWSFNDIRSDALVFRAEASTDGGTTWRLQSEDHMRRQRAAAGAR